MTSGEHRPSAHAVVVGIGQFAPRSERGEEPDEGPLDESDTFPPLAFAGQRARAVAASLTAAGCAVHGGDALENVTLPALQEALDHCVSATATAAADAGPAPGLVVHLLSHGRATQQGGLFIATHDSPGQPGLYVPGFLDQLEEFAQITSALVLLDVCFAGTAVDWQWQAWRRRLRAKNRKVWVLAAAAPWQKAFEGRFSAAVSTVLGRLAQDGLGTDPAVAFVPLRLVAQEIRRELELRRVREDGIPQEVDATPLALGEEPQVHLFRNPLHARGHGDQFRAQVEELLRGFLEELDPVLDGKHFVGRAFANPASPATVGRCLFSGREEQLSLLSGWLDDPDSPGSPRLRVVTGRPGAGKSALVGMLVCAAHPELADVTFELLTDVPLPGVAQQFTFGAVHARGRTVQELLNSLARQLGVAGPPSPGAATAPLTAVALATALEDRAACGDPTATVVIDALDEAAAPGEVLETLIGPLLRASATRPRAACRLLIGTRQESELRALLAEAAAAGGLTDLDDIPADVTRADLAHYIRRCLASSARYNQSTHKTVREALSYGVASALAPIPNPRTAVARGPSAPDPSPGPASSVVADLPSPGSSMSMPGAASVPGPFLLAGVYLHHLLTSTDAVTLPTLDQTLREVPTTLPDMLDMHLRRIGTPWARPVLTALAHAKGPGLPLDLIPALAAALGPKNADPLDLPDTRTLLTDLEFYLRHSIDEDGTRLHRLYHHELVTFLGGRGAPAPVLDALLSTVRAADGRLRWDLAHPYLLRHVAGHAADAGRVDELLADPEFLVRADPAAIAEVLDLATSPEACVAAAVFRASPQRGDARDFSARRETLALDAARFNQPRLGRALALGGGTGEVTWIPLWATGSHVSEALIGTLTGHADRVTAVCLAEVARRHVLFSGSADHTVRAWDVADGRLRGKPMRGHDGTVRALALVDTVSGPLLASAGNDATVRLWHPETGRQVALLAGHRGPVTTLAVATWQQRHVLASAGADGTIRVWDPARPAQPVIVLRRTGRSIRSLALVTLTGPDGRPEGLLAVAVQPGFTWRWWDLERGGPYRNAPPGHTQAAAVASTAFNGRPAIATTHLDGTVQIWDVAEGRSLLTLRQQGIGRRAPSESISAVTPTSDAPTVVKATGDDVTVHRIGWGSGRSRSLPGHETRVDSVCVGQAGERLVVGSGGRDGTVRLWRLSGAQHSRPLPGHPQEVGALALVERGSGTIVASASRATLWLRAIEDGGERGRLDTDHGLITVCAPAQVDDQAAVLTAGADGRARLWDISTRQALLSPLAGHRGWVHAIAAGRVGSTPVAVTGGSDSTVRLWDLSAARAIGEPLAQHSAAVQAVAVTSMLGRTFVAAGGDDRRMTIWDVTEPGRPLLLNTLSGHTGAVGSVLLLPADDRLLAVSASTDRTVRLWDATAGEPLGAPLNGHSGAVTALAAGRLHGRRVVVSAGRDRRVCAWDPAHREPVAVFHLPRVATHLVCTDDGDLVVAIGRDIAVLGRADH
ncbi:AAA family ATPase [Streptomyces sp. NPDC101151]|uniref:AAA family ATPase n=1 Tax=Streptomyces sp. NPDC101151 TaxID=3366115 RepID=UPI00380F5984